MLMLADWVPIVCLHASLGLVLGGVVMIDCAVQAIHVTNQSLIVAARPNTASRLVGGYMAFYSIGTGFGDLFDDGLCRRRLAGRLRRGCRDQRLRAAVLGRRGGQDAGRCLLRSGGAVSLIRASGFL